MEIIKHRNGTVTLKGLTQSDLSDFEASLFGRGADFQKSANGPKPSDQSYASWDAETWETINRNIATRHFELASMLQETLNHLRKR